MRFLERPGIFMDGFLFLGEAFAEDRKVSFTKIEEEKKKIGAEMFRLATEGSKESIRELIFFIEKCIEPGIREEVEKEFGPESKNSDNLNGFAEKYREIKKMYTMTEIIMSLCPSKDYEDIARFITDLYDGTSVMGDRSLADVCADEMESTDRKERIARYLSVYGIHSNGEQLFLFDEMFKLKNITGYVLSKESQDIIFRRSCILKDEIYTPKGAGDNIQQVLQNVFDFAIAAGGTNGERGLRMSIADVLFSENPKETWVVERLKQEIEFELAIEVIGVPEDIAIELVTKKLLNDVYRMSVGLTYDEILEAFKKE